MRYEAFEDRQNKFDWRVEAFNEDGRKDRDEGECYMAIFTGSLSRERAQEYANWKNSQISERASN